MLGKHYRIQASAIITTIFGVNKIINVDKKKGKSIRTSTIAQHNMHFIYNQRQTNVLTHLFDGALEFVHVAFKKREMGEKEILEAIVLLSVGRQHEDDPNGDLLLPSHTEAWSAAFIRHVEALLH